MPKNFAKVKFCITFVPEIEKTVLSVSTAKVAQLVEHNLAKVRVAGSSPVFRSKFARIFSNHNFKVFTQRKFPLGVFLLHS